MRTRDMQSTGATYGGPNGATYGGDAGAAYGEQRAERFYVRLVATNGRRTEVTPISHDRTRTHTGLSDIKITIPRLPALREFAYGQLDLLYGDAVLFRAEPEMPPGPGLTDEGTATLSGRGIGISLTRTETTVSVEPGEAWHEVIAGTWAETEFDATVIAPETPLVVQEAEEFSGTYLSILQDLHARAGMRFTIQHQLEGKRVESYRSSETRRERTWVHGDGGHESEFDGTEFTTTVRVEGAVDPETGVQATGTSTNQEAADALSFDVPPVTIEADELTTDAACEARAKAELEERSMGPLSGTINIVPDPRQPIQPGYHYEVPEWSEDTDDPVRLPVDEVSASVGQGDVSGQLTVNEQEDLFDVIRELREN